MHPEQDRQRLSEPPCFLMCVVSIEGIADESPDQPWRRSRNDCHPLGCAGLVLVNPGRITVTGLVLAETPKGIMRARVGGDVAQPRLGDRISNLGWP